MKSLLKTKIIIITGIILVLGLVGDYYYYSKAGSTSTEADNVKINQKQNIASKPYTEVELPENVSKDDFLKANDTLRNRLINYSKDKLNGQTEKYSDTVVFTKNGEPILGNEAAKNTANAMTNNAAIQSTTNRITLSYSTSDYTTAEITKMKSFMSQAYPLIEQIYGPPAFSFTAYVEKAESIPGRGGAYWVGAHIIGVMSGDALETLLHETIHAFHDYYILESKYEESITETATIEIHDRLVSAFFEEKTYHNEFQDYEVLNQKGIDPYYPLFEYQKYYLGAVIWRKGFIEDSNFLKNFNYWHYYYQNRGLYVSCVDVMKKVKSTIEGIDTKIWAAKHYIWGSAQSGYNFYFSIQSGSFYGVCYYYDTKNYTMSSVENALVNIKVYDYQKNLVKEWNEYTNYYGEVSVSQYDGLPTNSSGIVDYFGRFTAIATIYTPQGTITKRLNESIYGWPSWLGLHGHMAFNNSGTLEIISVANPAETYRTTVINGAFNITELKDKKGQFRLRYTSPNNVIQEKLITKSDSYYIVNFEEDINKSLSISTPTISPNNAAANLEEISGSFNIKNNDYDIKFDSMGIAARYGNKNVNFDADTNVTIRSGETYNFSKNKIFSDIGSHKYWIYGYIDGVGYNLSGYYYFNTVPITSKLKVISWSRTPSTPREFQYTTSKFTLKNYTSSSITLSVLGTAVRYGSYNRNYPGASNITIAPGATYTYSARRKFSPPGTYKEWFYYYYGGVGYRVSSYKYFTVTK